MRWTFLPVLFLGSACLAQNAITVDAPPGSEAMGNALACFSNEGFAFIRFENRHVKLIGAKP